MTDDTTRAGENGRGSPDTPAQLVVRVLRDGVVGAVAGAAGSAALIGSLAIAALLGGFSLDPIGQFPTLLGLGAVLTPDQLTLAGGVLFVLGGMIVWPLMLATVGMYLPGDSYAVKGLVFGPVIWTGFVLYFYGGATGFGLVVYVALSFVGHLGYGFVTGAMMDRLFGEEGPLVSMALQPPDERPGGAVSEDPTPGTAPDVEADTPPERD